MTIILFDNGLWSVVLILNLTQSWATQGLSVSGSPVGTSVAEYLDYINWSVKMHHCEWHHFLGWLWTL